MGCPVIRWIVQVSAEAADRRSHERDTMPSVPSVMSDKPTQSTPTEAEFRAAGFTAIAANYPLSEAVCQWLADFNGVRVEQMPRAWRYAPNAYMQNYLEAVSGKQ